MGLIVLQTRVRQSDQHLFFFSFSFFFFSVHHKHSLTCSPRRRFSAGSLLLQTEIGPASAPIPKKKKKKKKPASKKKKKKKKTKKHPQFSGDFAESVLIFSCQTHCAPALTATWYVIHTSVWVTCHSLSQ